MLFNSNIFIFLYLPVVFIGFYWIAKYSHHRAIQYLTAASIFFYGWWDVRFVGLLLGSVIFNYAASYLISKQPQSSRNAKTILIGAIAINLCLLGYFKYSDFFVQNLNQLLGTSYFVGQVLLPLGISFFTFTQLAFLVDTWQGKVKDYDFIHYTLFVTYFPHLIAGPVLHHTEMMPQFDRRDVSVLNWDNLSLGFTVFVFGLAKKVLIADQLAPYANTIFDAVHTGAQPMFFDAWIGALTFTFQLYFDFSGYCDMAVGLSLLFNVRLPLNFNSPYKATSIIDFWRRWHMSLSRFLRDYLYIPLGGNRKGNVHRYLNLMITMVLGGFWHGAGWTFIVWGGLHGIYLMINHAWHSYKKKMHWQDGGRFSRFGAGLLTFVAVVIGWVFFRADSFASASIMLQGMSGLNGVSLPGSMQGTGLGNYLHQHFSSIVFNKIHPMSKGIRVIEVVILVIIVWFLPNTAQFTAQYKPVIDSDKLFADNLPRFNWQPAVLYLLLVMILFYYSLGSIDKPSTFLYFQF
jgi:D-alanyl-lipoteichoic acid acyltransferase DltB (MBOAT superfamily)